MSQAVNVSISKYNKLLPLTIGGFALICIIIYAIYGHLAKQEIKAELLHELVIKTKSTHDFINKRFIENKDMLHFLFSTPPVQGITRAINNQGIDPFDGTTIKQWKNRLETIFSAFITNNPEIRQIRYITKLNSGRELVRVERQDNKVVILSDGLLQNKQETDYYKAIEQLHINEDYISDITLNREYGIIEDPIWPTYRVARPIFDKEYQFFGFLILNIDATSLLAQLQHEYSKSDFNLYILNTDGYFVSAKNEAMTFGFDLDNHDATWSKLTNTTKLINDETIHEVLFNQKPYYMYGKNVRLSLRDFRSLNIVGSVAENNINQIWQDQRKFVLIIISSLFVLFFILAVFYQRYINKILRLYDNQSRYEAIISGSSDAIINIDLTGKILSWNESATYLFGLNSDMALTKGINQVIGVTEKKYLISKKQLSEVISKKQPALYEVINTSDEAEPIYYSVSLSPVFPHDSESASSVAAIIRDITESKTNELKILNHNESLEVEVQQRTKQLEIATKEAVNANQSKSAFVANISHEIRTPLNGIAGMLELISNDPLSAKQINYVKLAKSSITNLTVLINDLLNLSKIESGKLDIELDEFNIIQTISSVIETMSIKCKEKNIDLRFDWRDVNHEYLVSDDYRIKQVLINLIGNAIKFTSDEGTIMVSVHTQLNDQNPELVECIINVKDNGIGMSKAQQNKLFQPFTQATASIDKQYGGTGLGLSISKKLTKLLGGTISVKSEENVGSTFTFSIQSKLLSKRTSPLSSAKLLGKKIILISNSSTPYDALLSQLKNWQAEVYLLNKRQAEEHIHNATAPDLMLVDSEVFNTHIEDYSQFCESENNCKLIILQNPTSPFDSNVTDVHFEIAESPILPYQFANIVDSIFTHEITKAPTVKSNKKINVTNQHSVLIVDDNEINRIVAAGLLESLPIEITSAANGQEAIDLLNNSDNKFDLILMDCQMPVLDGFQATELIRKGQAGSDNSSIVIIAMTAGAMAGDKDACIQAGMDDFIMKPLEVTGFRNTVSNWLKKPVVNPDSVDINKKT